MIHEQIKKDMKAALREHEEIRLTTLRGLLSDITNELVSQKRKPDELLEDEGVLTVVKRAVKQRKDSIEQFERGGREDLVERERAELAVLEEYMPALASREDIEQAVDTVLNSFDDTVANNTGVVVGAVMKHLNGNADGALVKEIVAAKTG